MCIFLCPLPGNTGTASAETPDYGKNSAKPRNTNMVTNIQQSALEHKPRRHRRPGKKVMKLLNTSLFHFDGVIQRWLRSCRTIKSFRILCASTKDGTGYRDPSKEGSCSATEEILLCTVSNIFLVSPSHKLVIVQPRSVCFKKMQQSIQGPNPLLSEELHLGIHSWIQP